jgi:multidrug transporter EmrE-like cation transporter
MKTLSTFLISVMVAAWIAAAAILSVQNFIPVSLKFFTIQLIEIPVGLVLAFSVGVGMIGTAIAQVLLFPPGSRDNSSDE